MSSKASNASVVSGSSSASNCTEPGTVTDERPSKSNIKRVLKPIYKSPVKSLCAESLTPRPSNADPEAESYIFSATHFYFNYDVNTRPPFGYLHTKMSPYSKLTPSWKMTLTVVPPLCDHSFMKPLPNLRTLLQSAMMTRNHHSDFYFTSELEVVGMFKLSCVVLRWNNEDRFFLSVGIKASVA